jgi:hypothetical protein
MRLHLCVCYIVDAVGQTLVQDVNAVPLLPAAERTRLKGQSFVRPERIKEVLESTQSVLMQRVPDLKAVMKVGILVVSLE